ncbi:hypothetical protein PE067_16255 [Paracoccus sp. DMF-8]|uniref:hypothetical protein n=1 Tax=Paracoccus sp. DMF-8 TaxID=3019445 RepID=UPI0023E42B88|nr:hypothetical protein [Paracoccus sp. DMF-8]MDF3607561.1 hypothetical protein [Paracoccus sp. DMF-8]
MDTTDDITSLILEPAEAPEPAPEAMEEEALEVEEAPEEIAADEGDEDDDDEQDEGPQEQRIIVKVDGEEREVTLDDLKRSYSGQAYIQKGMQEAAEAKKQAEAVFQQLQEGRNAVAALYQRMQAGQLALAPTPPDPELINTDPFGYLRQKEAFEVKLQEYRQQQAQIQQAIGQQSQADEHAMRVYAAEQARELSRHIPDFADAEKAGALGKKLVAAGDAYGYSAEEIGGVMDARAIRVLHDAMQWRALQGAKKTVEEKAQKARPIVKPGAKAAESTGRKGQAEKARAQMHKTGSVDDVAKYLLT